MKKEEKFKNKIIQLSNDLTRYSQEYYNKNHQSITDNEYDVLLKQLEKLEIEYPQYKLQNSPTGRVGFLPLEYLNKYRHKFPMLSLQNALNEQELSEWFTRIKKDLKLSEEELEDLEFFIEPKIDGVSISLDYENGILVSASTRGDGKVGEEVLQNVKQINSIPWIIDYKEPITIRGEVFSSISNFKKVNNENNNKFSNPRNFASGSIRILDYRETRKRNLSVFFYQVMSDKKIISSQRDVFEFLKINKLPYYKGVTSKKGNSDIINKLREYDVMRKDIDFEIDGVVIKINEHKLWDELGNTIKFPKSSIAFKFNPEIAITRLVDIFPTVGRTGKVIYNAKLEPVQLLGTIISFATLHNLEYIKNLDLRIGDMVEVKKSGEIIPKVMRPLLNLRSNKIMPWKELESCHFCKKELSFSETKNDQFCLNVKCPSRNLNKLIHFASKSALDFVGLGDKNLELFFNKGILSNFQDFYLLENKQEKLKDFIGFGERTISKILRSIKNSKKLSLERIIFALGIDHIGVKSSLDLAKYFKNIDYIIRATIEELENISDFGIVKAKSVFQFFQLESNLQLIEFLKQQKVNFTFLENEINYTEARESKFYKKTVVITGAFEDIGRQEAEKILISQGAIIRKSVSSKTNFVIAGDNPSKNKISGIDANKIIITKQFKDIL